MAIGWPRAAACRATAAPIPLEPPVTRMGPDFTDEPVRSDMGASDDRELPLGEPATHVLAGGDAERVVGRGAVAESAVELGGREAVPGEDGGDLQRQVVVPARLGGAVPFERGAGVRAPGAGEADDAPRREVLDPLQARVLGLDAGDDVRADVATAEDLRGPLQRLHPVVPPAAALLLPGADRLEDVAVPDLEVHRERRVARLAILLEDRQIERGADHRGAVDLLYPGPRLDLVRDVQVVLHLPPLRDEAAGDVDVVGEPELVGRR